MKQIIAALLLLAGTSTALAQSDTERLLGTWHLQTWISEDGAPRCLADEGDPFGQIIYSNDGFMAVYLGCSEDDTPGGYYGSVTVNEADKTVTHHVRGSSSGTLTGNDLVRTYNLDTPGQVTLTTPQGSQLTWVRER